MRSKFGVTRANNFKPIFDENLSYYNTNLLSSQKPIAMRLLHHQFNNQDIGKNSSLKQVMQIENLVMQRGSVPLLTETRQDRYDNDLEVDNSIRALNVKRVNITQVASINHTSNNMSA